MRILRICLTLALGWLLGLATLPAVIALSHHGDDVMIGGAGGPCAYVCGNDAGIGMAGLPATNPPNTAGVARADGR